MQGNEPSGKERKTTKLIRNQESITIKSVGFLNVACGSTAFFCLMIFLSIDLLTSQHSDILSSGRN